MSINCVTANNSSTLAFQEASAEANSSSVPAPSGFDFDCNVFALLTEALTGLSNSDFELASVQADAILQNTNVESNLARNSMAGLNKIEGEMQDLIDGGDLTSQTVQDQMSLYNTDFSTAMQEGNMNMQMVQAQVQGQETESQLTMSSLKNLSSLFSIVGQIYQFTSSLIAK